MDMDFYEVLSFGFLATFVLVATLSFKGSPEPVTPLLEHIKEEYNCKRVAPVGKDGPVAKHEWWYCDGAYVVVIHQEELER